MNALDVSLIKNAINNNKRNVEVGGEQNSEKVQLIKQCGKR